LHEEAKVNLRLLSGISVIALFAAIGGCGSDTSEPAAPAPIQSEIVQPEQSQSETAQPAPTEPEATEVAPAVEEAEEVQPAAPPVLKE
jgi:hypothetical protein